MSNFKKFCLIIMLSGTALTAADSSPSLEHIGEATFIVKKDIPILPNADIVFFQKGIIVDRQDLKEPYCYIEMKAKSSKPRVLKSEKRSITLSGNSIRYGSSWRNLETKDDKSILDLGCTGPDRHSTIQDFSEAFGSYLERIKAQPEEATLEIPTSQKHPKDREVAI